MFTLNVKIKKLVPGVPTPKYQTPGAAGMDLCAQVGEDLVVIGPGARAAIPTGIAIEIPQGVEAQVRPRGSLARKHGITVLNSPGTVDSDFRGEIMVVLINHSQYNFLVAQGDRIAQLVFCPVFVAELHEVEDLSETQRGEGCFGSTGTSG